MPNSESPSLKTAEKQTDWRADVQTDEHGSIYLAGDSEQHINIYVYRRGISVCNSQAYKELPWRHKSSTDSVTVTVSFSVSVSVSFSFSLLA